MYMFGTFKSFPVLAIVRSCPLYNPVGSIFMFSFGFYLAPLCKFDDVISTEIQAEVCGLPTGLWTKFI